MFARTHSKSSSFVVAPKIPPSALTDSRAPIRRDSSLATVQSSTSTQSNALSLASRIVLDTQTSVVTPHKTRFLIPLMRRINSKSVCAKAERPGLSTIGSFSRGYSSLTMSWPGSPRTKRRPKGPLSPMPRPEGLSLERALSRLDNVDRSGRWPSQCY